MLEKEKDLQQAEVKQQADRGILPTAIFTPEGKVILNGQVSTYLQAKAREENLKRQIPNLPTPQQIAVATHQDVEEVLAKANDLARKEGLDSSTIFESSDSENEKVDLEEVDKFFASGNKIVETDRPSTEHFIPTLIRPTPSVSEGNQTQKISLSDDLEDGEIDVNFDVKGPDVIVPTDPNHMGLLSPHEVTED